IRSVRSQLIALGAAVAAPCPHNRDCPLAGSDWCHFAVRVGRTRRHRLAKGGELGWEDEKFSYCGFVRSGAPAAAARIIRPPKVTKGEVALSLCAATGLEDRVIPRRNAAEYRSARKLRWGDGV
ncbi:methyltransferase type 11, partial [Candidatus Sumerlaeota bacterium]|nr:methyltransferase type 11 [Candidatus Sumerlaeota bacterium]